MANKTNFWQHYRSFMGIPEPTIEKALPAINPRSIVRARGSNAVEVNKGSYTYDDPYSNPLESNSNIWKLYKQSDIVNRAVNSVARAGSQEWKLLPVDPDQDVDEALLQPITDFLNKPNDQDTSFETVIFKIIRDIMLFGVCFLELSTNQLTPEQLANIPSVVKKALGGLYNYDVAALATNFDSAVADALSQVAADGLPTFVKVMPAWTIEVVSDPRGRITGYKQRDNHGNITLFGPEEVLQILAPQSMNPHYGDSMISSVILPATILMKINQRRYAKLENDIAIDKVFKLPETTNSEEVTRYHESIMEQYKGAKANGSFLVIAGGEEVQELKGTTEGDYLHLSEQLKEDISKCLGVPLAVLGSDAGNAMSNGGQDGAWALFIENTVNPLVRHVEGFINNALIARFEAIGITGYEFKLQTTSQDDEAALETKYNQMILNGSATINEVRKLRGWEPYTDVNSREKAKDLGDVPFIAVKGAITVDELQAVAPPPPAPIVVNGVPTPVDPNNAGTTNSNPPAPIEKALSDNTNSNKDALMRDLRNTLRELRKSV